MNPLNLVLWEAPSSGPIAVRVAVAGDFLPAGKSIPRGIGWQQTASEIAPLLEDVSIGMANVEAVLDADGLSPEPGARMGDIVAAPGASLDYLRASHFLVAGVANNHSYDFGPAGVERSREAILRRGLWCLGAGGKLGAQPEVFVWNGPRGVRVGFWAAAKAARPLATRGKAGVEPATADRAAAAAAEMRRQGARFCVALLHVGCARTNRPDPEDAALMDSIVRCGFDVVGASHSHRIGGWKSVVAPTSRAPSFCFYGLGSLVSGYAASPIEREGLVVVASLSAEGSLARLEARPTYLDTSGLAALPDGETGDTILERFRNLATEIAEGSFARFFYRDVSEDLFRFYFRDARKALRRSGLRGLARKVTRVRMRHIRRLMHKVIG